MFFARRNGRSHPSILTNPFPPPHQQMIAMVQPNFGSLQGGKQPTSSRGSNVGQSQVFMCEQEINLQTRSKSYDTTTSGTKGTKTLTLIELLQ